MADRKGFHNPSLQVAENGEFEVLAGVSSADIRCRAVFTFSGGVNRAMKKRQMMPMDVTEGA